MAAETPVLASVAATDHPALELAEPVTSPVKATDCAEANSVAEAALPLMVPVTLPSRLPLNVVASIVPVEGCTVTAAANFEVSVAVDAEAVFFARRGYLPVSDDSAAVCVTLVSVFPEAGSVTVMLDAEVMRPLASTVNLGTVNVSEWAGDALDDGP